MLSVETPEEVEIAGADVVPLVALDKTEVVVAPDAGGGVADF
jgi:hypothetical protein